MRNASARRARRVATAAAAAAVVVAAAAVEAVGAVVAAAVWVAAVAAAATSISRARGVKPVFANPGLLNLTMPALWETGTGQLELLAMAPTGVLANALDGRRQPR